MILENESRLPEPILHLGELSRRLAHVGGNNTRCGIIRTINVAHGGTRDDVVGRPLEACAKRLLPGRIVVLQCEQVGVAVAARDSPEITPISVAEWAPCAWY
jgi:hypothetical protein